MREYPQTGNVDVSVFLLSPEKRGFEIEGRLVQSPDLE